MDKYVFATAILLLCLLNIAQYVFAYGLVEGMDPWSLYFGFPFFYYEHGIRIHPLARILYLGIVGNFIFAVMLGYIVSVIPALLEKQLSGKNDFFRQCTIDVPVFLTVTLIVILLNAGQYLIGYGGLGFVGEPDPSGLTLGFPFNYYYYSFADWKGEVVYFGIMGNLAFAAGLGAIAGVIAAFFRRCDSQQADT